MLWVNGYTGTLSQITQLTPKPGGRYWGKHGQMGSYVMQDWSAMYIDPDMSLLSNAKARFKAGYHFALENERIIRNNILINGNLFQMVAHGTGIAFAEGISAYFYDEKGIVTDTAIYIPGSVLGRIPQSRRAVNCRILASTGKPAKSKIRYEDILIHETDLSNGFCKYSIVITEKQAEEKTGQLYFRGSLARPSLSQLRFGSPMALWATVYHAMIMYKSTDKEDAIYNVKSVMLEKFIMN